MIVESCCKVDESDTHPSLSHCEVRRRPQCMREVDFSIPARVERSRILTCSRVCGGYRFLSAGYIFPSPPTPPSLIFPALHDIKCSIDDLPYFSGRLPFPPPPFPAVVCSLSRTIQKTITMVAPREAIAYIELVVYRPLCHTLPSIPTFAWPIRLIRMILFRFSLL